MKLSKLCGECGGKLVGEDVEIEGLCTDSRVAERGDLFFCYRGEKEDLHAFSEEAYFRGARAVMCERPLSVPCPQIVVESGRRGMAQASAAFFGHPERHMQIVGVTGTNGKTTCCHMLLSVLQEGGRRPGLIGTLGAKYMGRVIEPDLTTPDPVSLFSLLSDMQKEGVDSVVMEVSAHALALEKVSPITFEVGIFTNLTRDHLDFFKDMQSYRAAKRKLFEGKRCAFGVYNADDPFSRELEALPLRHVSYGLTCPADAFAVLEEETIFKTRALFNLSDDLLDVEISLPGRHNVSNALAAACAAKRLGISKEATSYGIQRVSVVEGRMEHVALFRGAHIFVDFAHTPDGLEKSLQTLRAYQGERGRLIVLFGCGGNRDEGKREMMGEVAAKGADYAFLTSDNPRFEEPCAIIGEIERGYSRYSKEYAAVEEREKAIELAMKTLKEGDILLIAGKGGERYQEIMGIKYDFSDKDVVIRFTQTL